MEIPENKQKEQRYIHLSGQIITISNSESASAIMGPCSVQRAIGP